MQDMMTKLGLMLFCGMTGCFNFQNRSRDWLILLNDFTCRETRLHNADWFIRMITLGSIQRYAV